MNDDLRFAQTLADAADAVTTARFRALDLRVETKPDLSPVSEADRRAEEVIRELVGASGRGEGVLGEEFGDDGGDAKWIVDPIDGTTSYVRGVPVWATLLALEREGAVVSTTSSRRMPGGWSEIVARAWSNRGFGDFWQHCLVAEGAVDVACDGVVNLWDYAGVQLVVEEAGGRCTTFAGEPPAEGASFVATNGLLHDEAVEYLRG